MLRIRRALLTPLFCVLATTACGGGSQASNSEQAFCDEIEKLDSLDFDSNVDSAAKILMDLAKKAPSDEIRNALGVIAPIFDQLAEADPNDPNAMNEIFEMMSSPEVASASEVLESFSTDICGFEDSQDSTP